MAKGWVKTFKVRQQRIRKEGSQYFTWQVPAMAPSAEEFIQVNESFPAAKKYAPLDWLEIVNNEDAINVTLQVNGQDSFSCPAGTIRTLTDTALWQLVVTNTHAGDTTTLNLITITLRRSPDTVDKWLRRNE
tara:strand:+ start:4395 stop:4790 length:396 start_codon:yes stop_codon:yes gene_type:complete